ncbi:MAG: hypothetical protein LBI42_10910 [Chitinispirillales bacterium]|jgi:hypothetical protein|nr:hypothetical protein [Chitinispirillales bacterium]
MFVKSKAARFVTFFCVLPLITIMGFAACAPRVSYTVKTLYTDPQFTGRMLSGFHVALLPLLNAGWPVELDELEELELFEMFQTVRPDIKFVSTYEFETDFTFKAGEASLFNFYKLLFNEEMLALKNADSLWNSVRQHYLLVYSIRNGMSVRNIDTSVYKKFIVECELWSVEHRAVVWRAQCGGVSEDKRSRDKQMLAESMKYLAQMVPAVQPGYGPESW